MWRRSVASAARPLVTVSSGEGREAAVWTLLGEWGVWEYWLAPDGDTVYRRQVSDWNVLGADGSPMGARWESSLVHFQRYVAGALPV